jgi:hypothetical protein
MENKDILFFGTGVALAMGFLYFQQNPNAISQITGGTGIAPTTSNGSIPATPTIIAPPATTINTGTSTVNGNTSTVLTPAAQPAPVVAVVSQVAPTGATTSQSTLVNSDTTSTNANNQPTSNVQPVLVTPTQSTSGGGLINTSTTIVNDAGIAKGGSQSSDINTMFASASGIGSPYNDPNVLKRPVVISTINSIYQQSPYANDYTPLSTNN